MITNPLAFVTGGETLAVGVALTAIAYLTKLAAAWLAARIYGYNRDEMWTMWGLSQCQAAVTLPTILVGVELGLFPQAVFGGTMLMILATSITSPLIVQRFGAKLQAPFAPVSLGSLFTRVLLPLNDPQAQENMIALADILTRSKGGKLFPLHVALESSGTVYGLAEQRRLPTADAFKEAEHIHPLMRVDNSISRGILHSAIENDVSVIMLGWRGKPKFRESIFGTVVDDVLWRARIPVLVTRLTHPVNGWTQVVMLITRNSTAVDYLDEMAEAAAIIAEAVNAPLLVLADTSYFQRVCECVDALKLDHPHQTRPLGGNPVSEVTGVAGEDTLVLLSTTGTRQRFQTSLGHLPEEVAARTPASLAVIHYPV
jgi:nucleotide-binding universal stress UspA family protein